MEQQVWRANVSTQKVTTGPVPESWQRLGGRALIPRILIDEIPPTCDPLGPFNKLLFTPGLLVGHMVSSCDRISVGGKSPLTGGVKESNAGGSTGLKMAYLSMKVLIIEGAPSNNGWWMLHLSHEGGRFERIDELAGLGVYQASERLLDRFGKKVGISLIGPGGEMQLGSAGIQNLDKDLDASRINARGGLGAVMGSKGLKAIVFDAEAGEEPLLADPKLFKEAKKYYTKELLAHPQTTVYSDYGTAAMAMMCDGFGALPTRNFSAGHFEQVEKISGENMREMMLSRGDPSQTTHACMAGCIIRCSNCFGSATGEKIVSPVEYETIGLVGSNLGIDSLDDIARLNWEINDLGLDTIEIGASLGVAAEAGLMEFGDAGGAMKLVHEIRQGTPLGRIVGNGAATAGKVLGVRRVPVAKGQAISAYDPRAIKGTGVTYATSPQGADHTAGLTIRAKVDHVDPQGQVDLSRTAQITMAGYDTLGACIFGGFGFAQAPGSIRDLLNGRYGWSVSDDILQELGRQTLKLEREFNQLAGFGPKDDRLPEWLTIEPLPPLNAVFDVPEEEMDGVFNW